MCYTDQVDMMYLLDTLTRYFMAASYSITPSRQLDAERIIAMGCITAMADRVMRHQATDLPGVPSQVLFQGFADTGTTSSNNPKNTNNPNDPSRPDTDSSVNPEGSTARKAPQSNKDKAKARMRKIAKRKRSTMGPYGLSVGFFSEQTATTAVSSPQVTCSPPKKHLETLTSTRINH